MTMANFYTTWTGHFKYDNLRLPLLSVTMTFHESAQGGFQGYVTENQLILPSEFESADISCEKPRAFTPWGSVAGEVIEGNLSNRIIPSLGVAINFVKLSDQLSGAPIFCRGAFNAQTGLIVGKWGIVEADMPSKNLPLNLKNGSFTLRQPNGGLKTALLLAAPNAPELLNA